ncbi:hypothetical protein HMPREF9057_00599, partial [Actinomyces sp. oral taxon 171 str. F0337]
EPVQKRTVLRWLHGVQFIGVVRLGAADSRSQEVTSSGTFLCARGRSTPSGTGILSLDAQDVPGCRRREVERCWMQAGRPRQEDGRPQE